MKWRKCIWGSGNKRGREKGGVALRKGELDGEREGAESQRWRLEREWVS